MNEAAPDADLRALKERKRGLDAVWLFTLAVAFMTVATPWYLRALEIDLAPVAWSLFGFALVYLAAALGTDRLRRRGTLVAAMGLSQLAGFVVLAVVWHLAGGLSNPSFLLLLALPVVAGAVLSPRWQGYATGPVAAMAALAVAWMEGTDLRWYASRGGLPVGWLADLLPELKLRATDPFPNLETPPSYSFVLCLVFALVLPALSLVARSLAEAMTRLEHRQDPGVEATEED